MRVLGSIWLVQLVRKRLNLSREAVAEVVESAAPDLALFESPEVEARYDAQIITASA